jgi:hypothetical protein
MSDLNGWQISTLNGWLEPFEPFFLDGLALRMQITSTAIPILWCCSHPGLPGIQFRCSSTGHNIDLKQLATSVYRKG